MREVPVAAEIRPDVAARAALAPFLLTRIPILAVGYLAVRIVGISPPPVEPATWRVSPNELLNLPARWDAFWYYTIATSGYHWNGDIHQQQSIVFFPLYPLLMRIGGAATAHQPLVAGVAVSLIAFYFALAYVYRLARLDLDREQAQTAMILLATYPFAVFFGAPYTESLFLLEAAAAFYYLQRDEPWKAGVAGLCAGLTRPNGCMLALPLAWLALAGRRGSLVEAVHRPHQISFARVVAASMPVVGMVVYSAYLSAHVGHAFAWIADQVAWGLDLVPAGDSAAKNGPALTTPYASAAVLIGNIGAFALAAFAVVPLTRRLGVPYGLLVVVSLVPPFLAHSFTSAGRFTSVLFPLFVWLAHRVPASRRRRWIGAFLAGQAVTAALFYTWRPLV